MSRYAVFFVFASGLAFAQQTRPSIVEAPLDFTPESVFGKATVGRPGSPPFKDGAGSLADRLAVQFHGDLTRQHPGLTVPLRATWMDVTSKARRLDWDKSDVALGKLAQDASTLYALYVSVSFGVVPGKGESHGILMVARVAHREGRPVGDPVTVFEPRAGRPVAEVFRTATAKLFASLNLSGLKLSLPSETPPPMVLAPPPSPPPEEIRVPLPEQPPGLVKKAEPSVLKPIGYAALAVGGAALVTGVVLFAATPVIHKDSNGFVLPQDATAARPAQRQQAAGVGLMVGGGILAVAGAVAAILPITRDTPVKATVFPVAGGGSIAFGGEF